MDLKLSSAEPTDAERRAIEAVFAAHRSPDDRPGEDQRFPDSGHAARGRRHILLPALHAVMAEVGYLSLGALNQIARILAVPPADVYGVATFYAMFATEPRAPYVAHVCDDVACGPSGGEEIVARLTEELGAAGEGKEVSWVRSPCLGLCERAPAVLLQLGGQPDVSIAPAAAAEVHDALRAAATRVDDGRDGEGETVDHVAPAVAAITADRAFADSTVSAPQTPDPRLRLLGRVGVVDPESLDDYRAHGGYAALRRAIRLGPSRVIKEVTDSGLTGRGGAAFPTGTKWSGVAAAPQRPHYLVCNADESEPGTFKDRVLMEGDPFAVVEAMTIAAYATGCEHGYLYVRGEYPLARERIGQAVELARERRFLGPDILGHGFDFEIEVRKGAGAYICGEETAVFGSIEGYRGEPRNKPPFPVVEGLFRLPTVVNNVETLVNVLPIVLEGGPAFAQIGTEKSTGPKLFCVAGAVGAPGTYEVPFGTTLRELLELAGGVRGNLQAVLLGGAAGGFVTPDDLDLRLSIEDAREFRTTLGSGVVLAIDDTVELGRLLMVIAAFMRDESCGQCVPCRVGTVRQEEALARLLSGKTRGTAQDEIALIREIGQAMRDASICGLGQTASSAIESAIERLGAFST